jgi:hypothetical protein
MLHHVRLYDIRFPSSSRIGGAATPTPLFRIINVSASAVNPVG